MLQQANILQSQGYFHVPLTFSIEYIVESNVPSGDEEATASPNSVDVPAPAPASAPEESEDVPLWLQSFRKAKEQEGKVLIVGEGCGPFGTKTYPENP